MLNGEWFRGESHVGWATSFWCTFLMRKVGKKRTLPTLHHYITLDLESKPLDLEVFDI
jgi:hypothetical protein